MPFKELRYKLQSRNITARTVLEAFVLKSFEIATEMNCITEFLLESLVCIHLCFHKNSYKMTTTLKLNNFCTEDNGRKIG